MRLIRLGALVLLVAAAPAGSDGEARAYRVRIAVTPGSGSAVQRLAVPPSALAAARTGDLSDLRVIDARGRAMPMTRAPAAEPTPRRDTLTAMPILGAGDALTVRGVSLRLDEQGRARVAQVDGSVAAAGSVVLGTLFDARAITGAARALSLDADVPPSQPVRFTVEASRDLSAWRTLGEKVVYRASASGGADATVPLGSAALKSDYLKVTWSLGSRALSPVGVRGAVLMTRQDGATADAEVEAMLPPLVDARTIAFAVPFATPIATIRVVPAAGDLLVPVRILGRDDGEHPWTLLGTGVAARAPSIIALNGAAFRTLRIEADPRGPGFTAPPTLRFGFASRAILFLAEGTPPYTLAVGKADTPDAYLPADSLLAQTQGKLVVAATASGGAARLALAPIDETGARSRRLILWAVLLLATGLLAGLAWLLWKRTAAVTT
jgi:hypothetical protein